MSREEINNIVLITALSVIANEIHPSLGPGIPRLCLRTLSTVMKVTLACRQMMKWAIMEAP